MKKSIAKKTVYAPYCNYPINAEDILAECGIIFSENDNGKIHVTMPWHIGDRDHWFTQDHGVSSRRVRFMKKFCRECYKVGQRLAKEEKQEAAKNRKGKKK